MIYKNLIVKIPDKCVVYSNNLVYLKTGKEYKKDKQYNVFKRVCVGKKIDEENMNPNENYETFFTNESVKKEAPLLSDTVSIGLNTVIDYLLDELQIKDILCEYYETDEYFLIRDLISYMISYETSVIQHFQVLSRRMNILSLTLRSDSFISNFFKDTITGKKIESFLNDFNSLDRFKDNLIYISYDSTNMNTSSSGIELAEYGHAKDDEGLPQVNLSLAIDHKESLPLFYELYPGFIIDNSQLIHMVDRLKEYGYSNIGLILDRGYFSKNNIDYLKKNNYSYLLMVKTNNKTIRELIEKYTYTLENYKYFITDHDVYGISEEIKLYQKDKDKVFIHLYFDSEKAAIEKKAFSNTLNELEKELKRQLAKHTLKESLSRFNKYFSLYADKQGYLTSYKFKEKEIKETIKEFGYFAIITSNKMEADEALTTYRNRDSVEKLFRSLKTDLDYTKYHIHSSSSLVGKTFIVFLATIIRSQIFNLTKDLRKQNRKEYTVNAIINNLLSIEATKNAKDKYVRRYSLTSTQKNILSKFNLSEKELDLSLADLNNR